MTDHDAVAGFSYALATTDGCQRTHRYLVSDAHVKEMRNEGWTPMTPRGDIHQAVLTTIYTSGKRLHIDLEGDEHAALSEHGRLDKMLASIVRGNPPGEALKRQLTKAFDLPKLPKIRRPKLA